MPPSNDSGSANIGTVIPTAWENAINGLRKERYLQSDRDDPPSKSEVVREAVELYLTVLKTHDAVPARARDDVNGIDQQSVLQEYALQPSGTPDIEIEAATQSEVENAVDDVDNDRRTDGGIVDA